MNVKICRFEYNGQAYKGIIKDKEILITENEANEYCNLVGSTISIDKVKLLKPVKPSKVVAVGLNYLEHIDEMGHGYIPDDPVLFIKTSSCVIGPNEGIILPKESERVDFEAELGVVIGKECDNVSAEDAKDYIFGYTCLNDVTARDLQRKDGQWTRGKGFRTFCPIGPHVETELDPSSIRVQSILNGEIKQDSNTKLLIKNVYELVSYISGIMTLLPGDIIATGTPKGVNPMKKGDIIEITIEGIGTLKNTII